MKLKYVKGNLLDADEPIIAHGCNAQGVMGSGVAKAIRAKYPQAYVDYKRWEHSHQLTLGDAIWSSQPNGPWVINAITQKYYGRDGLRYVDYGAIEDAFRSINEEMVSQSETRIAIPKIGAGLGGGDWDIIEFIIAKVMDPHEVTVYEL